MKKMMKKTTKPRVTTASLSKENEQLQKDLIEALESKRRLELEKKSLILIINDQKDDLVRLETTIVKVSSNVVKVETENIALTDAKASLLFEIKEYKEEVTKLNVLNNELKEGLDTLLKEYEDLEKDSVNNIVELTMIKAEISDGYNFFNAKSRLDFIKSILNSK